MIKSLQDENKILKSKPKLTEESTNASPNLMKEITKKQVIKNEKSKEIIRSRNYEVEYFQPTFDDIKIPKKRNKPDHYSPDDFVLKLKETSNGYRTYFNYHRK